MQQLLEMLKYKRPVNSETQKEFAKRFLDPVFESKDKHGNYIHIIGDKPNIAFMSHYDDVEKESGYRTVIVKDNIISTTDGNCLSADCASGIWLQLEMIKEGIEGVYICHQAEEIGLVGSTALVKDKPKWLKHIDVALSFDRYGDKSIITHQSGLRTASDKFAQSLSKILGMPQLKPDPTGSYTDSDAYSEIVPECSNLSVNYKNQHNKTETQDMDYLEILAANLKKADWKKLVVSRDPTKVEKLTYSRTSYQDDLDDIAWLAETYPRQVAEMLLMTFDVEDIFTCVQDNSIYDSEDEEEFQSYNYNYNSMDDYFK